MNLTRVTLRQGDHIGVAMGPIGQCKMEVKLGYMRQCKYDGACLKRSIRHIRARENERILQAHIRCMRTKEQKEGIVRFVSARPTQKDHVT